MPKTSITAPVQYRVEIADLHAHLFRITLTIARPQAQQDVALPVWIPGSYLVREFSKHLQHLQARQGRLRPTVQQLDKCSWRIEARTDRPLELSYEVYAFDASVRTAWLDSQRGFFNGTSLFLRVLGQERVPHGVELVRPKALPTWSVATGLSPQALDPHGFGHYLAADYDELVDCPVEMGAFWQGEFKAAGVTHRFVVAGAPPSFDAERLLQDSRHICETVIRFWHGRGKPPVRHYTFMLNVVDDGYGGLEHRNSTALICARRDLPRLGEAKAPEGYTTLMGLISHEYFHTWNVKRLRPQEFARYDYSRENYTELLWFFEGFTSYYDDLLLRRAGRIDDAQYLRLIGKTINQVLQTPGREVQSVAQASLDAWVKYYRQDENTPNATVSYYTKGALVALCLDLTLRKEGHGHLDDVMRGLWRRCQAGPMGEADLLAELQRVGHRDFSAEISAWVHSTGELPLRELLQAHGVLVLDEPAQLAQALGLRCTESNGVQIKTVLRGGAAERAGMAAGDEWLGVNQWRMNKLDDLPLYAGKASSVQALVARDRRLLSLNLQMPASVSTWRLAAQNAAKLASWLSPAG